MKNLIAAASIALTVFACRSGHPGPEQVERVAAADAQNTASFKNLASLAGEWEGVFVEYNNSRATSAFSVTAAGSVVREVMAAGTEHEMVNMYHLDGNRLLATHYCGAGNQPRMVATTASPKRVQFDFDSITNYTNEEHGFMGGLEIEFVDANHIIQRWTNYMHGQKGGVATFDLRRKM